MGLRYRYEDNPDWFFNLLKLLKERDPDVMELMGPAPIHEDIEEIEACVFDYRYAFTEKIGDEDEVGKVWRRSFITTLAHINTDDE